MRTATTELELLQPKSLREALRMLHEEKSLTPIAGCTLITALLPMTRKLEKQLHW